MEEKSKLEKFLRDEVFVVQSECGISLVNTKLQIINAELGVTDGRQVIHNTSSRIKSYESLLAKIEKKKISTEVDVVKDKINDIVGVRAICSYTDDLYKVADMLCGQKDVRLIKRKDYIENPKDSGYRSLHLVVEVPICFQNHTRWIKIEVQLRTTAMDYWAGLDYQFRYKKSKKEADIIGEELRDCAVVIEKMDKKVVELRKKLEAIQKTI